jgi:hypothetical protein
MFERDASFDEAFLGQAAGVKAGAAAGDIAPVPGEALEHPVQEDLLHPSRVPRASNDGRGESHPA